MQIERIIRSKFSETRIKRGTEFDLDMIRNDEAFPREQLDLLADIEKTQDTLLDARVLIHDDGTPRVEPAKKLLIQSALET